MRSYGTGKILTLAVTVALWTGSAAVMAAAPGAGQLPGQGKVTLGSVSTVSVDNVAHTLTIPLAAVAVINWEQGTTSSDINSTGTAGFNIGAGAVVTFTGAYPVLNIDSTGKPSQIFGALNAADNIFVANSNGIIVGSGGSITTTGLTIHGVIGLIGNTTFATTPPTAFDGTAASLDYNGSGGDVTVQSGSTLTGSTVLISGGGNVNVDLGALKGAASLSAGTSQGGVPVTPNKGASLAITGGTLTGSISHFNSAGTASNAAALDLASITYSVSGVFTNTGDLTLPAINGAVVNQGTLDTSGGGATFTSLTNAGSYKADGIIVGDPTIANTGGNLTNNGEITGGAIVLVHDGNINNTGSISGVTSLTTQSDSGDEGFAASGQYSINNAGTITGSAGLTINANTTHLGGTGNGSTGSFTNTGTLQLGSTDNLNIAAQNSLDLGGVLQVGTVGAFKTVSTTVPLGGDVTLRASGYDSGSDSFAAAGTLTVATPVVFAGGGTLSAYGAQVKLMSDLMGVVSDTDDTVAGQIKVIAGAALADDYAVRIASGKTVSAAGVYLTGDTGGDDNPNVILQGTVSGSDIEFGWRPPFASGHFQAISDLFSGPAGSIVGVGAASFSVGSFLYVEFDFTGAVKTAKYLNDANNFRYNYLPITNMSTGALRLSLRPVAYTTNGTSNGKSAVNVLVNGNVYLYDAIAGGAYLGGINGTSTAVTGVSKVPNTHLVLQSTGDIEVNNSGPGASFYWPGYVYLGTIDSTTAGAPLPGTLSAGNAIKLDGNFSNVLPGDVAGASGIHFMTGNALDAGAGTKVTTNASAWVNFPTDLLTQIYAQVFLTTPSFFGGVATGLIVNYGKLNASMFQTQAVDATK